jgi:oligoribonuclease NrnB/cAMP/cGMP phosphodiesterase (DHH superfamily)
VSSVIFHSSCADGIVAKEMLRSASEFLNLNIIRFVPFQYGMKVRSTELNYKSIWVDCCPESEEDFLIGLQNGCIYIDHHETVKAKFQKWFSSYPDQLIFGETTFGHSGASLTYNFIINKFRQARIEPCYILDFDTIFYEIQKLAALADTWQADHKDFTKARAMSSLIATVGNEIDLIGCHQGLINMAIAFDKNKRQQDAKKAANIPVTVFHNGLKVAIINDMHISDIAEILRNREKDAADLIVGFFYIPEGSNFKIIYSLRSNDNFDCSNYAKLNGGGGHVKAAGFSFTVNQQPFDPILYFAENLHKYLNLQS